MPIMSDLEVSALQYCRELSSRGGLEFHAATRISHGRSRAIHRYLHYLHYLSSLFCLSVFLSFSTNTELEKRCLTTLYGTLHTDCSTIWIYISAPISILCSLHSTSSWPKICLSLSLTGPTQSSKAQTGPDDQRKVIPLKPR